MRARNNSILERRAIPKGNLKGKITVLALVAGMVAGTLGILWVTNSILAQTFSGPQCSAGECSGAISISGGAFAVGTSSPISDTKFFILASSTQSAGFAVKVLSPGSTVTNGNDGIVRGGPLLLIRNDGKIGIGGFIGDTTTSTVVIGGNTRVNGTLAATTLVGTISGNLGAENIAAGSFGSIAGTGNYTFPSRIGVGSTTAPTYAVDVVGAIRATGVYYVPSTSYFIGNATYGFRFNNAADNQNNLVVADSGNTYIRGNLSVGTTTATYAITANGTIHSTSGGFRFPDGTTQTTTATGMGGSGTSGYVPKFTAATTLGNSGIQDNGTTVTLAGTADPALTVGNGTTGYAKIGATTLYDDGTYFSPKGGRPFYIRRADTGTTYIYSPSIYLGDGSNGTNVYFRDAALSGNSWSVSAAGAGSFASLVSGGSTVCTSANNCGYSASGHTHDYAAHRAEGTNYIDYSRYVYNASPYGTANDDGTIGLTGQWVNAHNVYVRRAYQALTADTLGGQTGAQLASAGYNITANYLVANDYVNAVGSYIGRAGTNGTPSNRFNIYWTGVAKLYIDTSYIGDFAYTSDKRVKDNISPLSPDKGLSAIRALNVVSFNWKDPRNTTSTQYGVIAQEAKEVFPELVRNTGLKTEWTPDGTYHFEYNMLWGPVLKAIQELDERTAGLGATAKDALASIGAKMKNGVISFADLVADKFSTAKLTIRTSDKDAVIGSGAVPTGSSSAVIKNGNVTPAAKVFITFRGNAGSWWISDIGDGSFTVQLASIAGGEAQFDYWIIPTE
jgi:hypothetical protein